MKVSATSGGARVGGTTAATARSGSGDFSLSGVSAASEAAAPARAANVAGVTSLEALIALQQVDGPLERRKRAVGRASKLLDVLDQMKVALLDGDLDAGSLDRLGRALREERAATEDPRLEQLLDEIETRAAVEQAKLEMGRAA